MNEVISITLFAAVSGETLRVLGGVKMLLPSLGEARDNEGDMARLVRYNVSCT